MDYDIAIIGAGSAGLVVASASATMGARVLLVENRKMGGDCLNYGCVPSKAFLKAAHLAKSMKKADSYGLKDATFTSDIKSTMAYVQSVIAQIEPHDSVERFESLGVHVMLGQGKIVDNQHIRVDNKVYSARRIVISTGSTAAIPPIPGLSEVDFYTNENIFEMERLPKKLVVLGGGPIGLELGQGFCFLGSEVHVIDGLPKLFAKDEAEVSDIMQEQFLKDGMNLHLGAKIVKLEKFEKGTRITIEKDGEAKTLECDAVLVSLGRIPNTQNLGLEEAGVDVDEKGFIKVDNRLQTSLKHVYACGDVHGGYMFTHVAGYEASVVIKNALVYSKLSKASYNNIAWTTYTSPKVAHVGMLTSEAEKKGISYKTITLPIGGTDRAKTEDDQVGFIKVLVDSKKKVLGATIVGEKADEIIPVLSLLVAKKWKLSTVNAIMYQYPIQGEIVKLLALKDMKDSVTPRQRKLLRKIVRKE